MTAVDLTCPVCHATVPRRRSDQATCGADLCRQRYARGAYLTAEERAALATVGAELLPEPPTERARERSPWRSRRW